MIHDIGELPKDDPVQARVIVIGTGVAGMDIASVLDGHGIDTLVLESGRDGFDPDIQALNTVEFSAKPHRAMDPDGAYHRYLPPQLRGASRVRQFGGTSNVWTGKWKHMQRSDFEPRDGLPWSGWPISYDDLLPHYRAVTDAYGFADLEAEARRPELVRLHARLKGNGIKATSFYWEAEPLRTAQRFRDQMRLSRTTRIVLGATATELLTDPGGRHVTGVVCQSLDGHRIVARADTIILAMGALENARLLLASDTNTPGGLGNAHDQVGRCYTDHLKHHEGDLTPGPLARDIAPLLQYGPKPRCCLCFALDDTVQRAHDLLEHVIYLKPIYETRRQRMVRRLTAGKPCRDAVGTVHRYKVKYVSEQVPQPDSRVRLSDDRDGLGMRRIDLAWTFTDHDHASVERTRDLAIRLFDRAGLGRIDFGPHPPSIDTMTDAAHQMGTTRMSQDPADGVTDTNARVHGVDNLFVAGSSVFPSCPSYSPTMTILAMARRLAVHVAGRETAAHRNADGDRSAHALAGE